MTDLCVFFLTGAFFQLGKKIQRHYLHASHHPDGSVDHGLHQSLLRNHCGKPRAPLVNHFGKVFSRNDKILICSESVPRWFSLAYPHSSRLLRVNISPTLYSPLEWACSAFYTLFFSPRKCWWTQEIVDGLLGTFPIEELCSFSWPMPRNPSS